MNSLLEQRNNLISEEAVASSTSDSKYGVFEPKRIEKKSFHAKYNSKQESRASGYYVIGITRERQKALLPNTYKRLPPGSTLSATEQEYEESTLNNPCLEDERTISSSFIKSNSWEESTTSKRNENKQYEQEILDYLSSIQREIECGEESGITSTVIEVARQAWFKLKSYFTQEDLYFRLLSACPGHNDNFMYVWSSSEHYLECEIFGNGEVEFFYRNKLTGDVWGEDVELEQNWPLSISEKFKLFV